MPQSSCYTGNPHAHVCRTGAGVEYLGGGVGIEPPFITRSFWTGSHPRCRIGLALTENRTTPRSTLAAPGVPVAPSRADHYVP